MIPLKVARQVPLSMGFPKQEYWTALPFPSLGDLPDPGIKPGSPALQVDSAPTELSGSPIKMVCKSQIITAILSHIFL